MLANFLEKSKPINFIIYLGLFFSFFFTATFLNSFTDGFIFAKVLEILWFLLLFLVVFFFYNFIVSKNQLTFDHSYAYFIFTLTIILFTTKLLDSKPLLLLIIHLLFLRKIYSLHSSKKVLQKLFDSGFWLGILFILDPLTIVFLLLIYASMLLQRKTTIHTLLSPIIGFISPLIIYFTYLFWTDSVADFIQLFQFNRINNLVIYSKNHTSWIFGSIILLSTIAIFLKSPRALSINNSFKKSWILLIINLIIAVIFALITIKKDGSEITFLLIPASIIIANGFEVIQKNIIKNILVGVLLITTIVTFFLL